MQLAVQPRLDALKALWVVPKQLGRCCAEVTAAGTSE